MTTNYDSDCPEEDNLLNEEQGRLLLVPRGTFYNDEGFTLGSVDTTIGVYLLEVQYGFVLRKDLQGEWFETRSLPVQYEHGMNEEVRIFIPPELALNYDLAYKLKFAPRSNRGERFQSETRYINLRDWSPLEEPDTRFIRLPIQNYAVHPWTDAQYVIKVSNFVTEDNVKETPSQPTPVTFTGKIKYIWYGFTEATEEEYLANRQDVPWKNSFGEFKEEGMIDISTQQHHHQMAAGDTSHKGYFMMRENWIRLPSTTANLVWKIGFEKWEGKSWSPSTYQGYHETQTFYYKTVYGRSRRSSLQTMVKAPSLLPLPIIQPQAL